MFALGVLVYDRVASKLCFAQRTSVVRFGPLQAVCVSMYRRVRVRACASLSRTRARHLKMHACRCWTAHLLDAVKTECMLFAAPFERCALRARHHRQASFGTSWTLANRAVVHLKTLMGTRTIFPETRVAL